jgi:glycosyltransferase involved in cell wall biosynthesis
MRTGHLAYELAARGHDVTWWASAFEHQTKRHIFPRTTSVALGPHVELIAIQAPGYHRNASLRRYVDHAVVARRFRKLAKLKRAPDLVLASFPDHLMAHQAASYADAHNIPLIVDVRDRWPDVALTALPWLIRGLARVLLARDFRKARETFRKADVLTSMMSSMLAWAQHRSPERSTTADKVYYLGSEPMVAVSGATPPPSLERIADRIRGRHMVVFVGTFGHFNNPTVVGHAARILSEKLGGQAPLVVLAGDGPGRLKAMKELAGIPNVELPGWAGPDEIAWLVRHAAVGVVPAPVTVEAFPNKVFTYLSAGLPIVSSMSGELRGLMEERGFGVFVKAGDAEGLAHAMETLLGDPALLSRMRENSRRAFTELFDATRIYQAFADLVETVLQLPRGPGKQP